MIFKSHAILAVVATVVLVVVPGCTKNAEESGSRPAAKTPEAARSARAPAVAEPAAGILPTVGTLRIKGTVQFDGKAPAPIPINMMADPYCARVNDKEVTLRTVAVDSSGRLADAFVYVKSGLEGRRFDVPTEAVVLDQRRCQYTPRVFGIQVGQPLEIRNDDATLHNVHSLPTKSRGFNLGMPMQGMKMERRFSRPEVLVRIKCDVHPWMSAFAGVVDHPFFAVTDEHGRFEIKGLPPGLYVVEAVHPKLGAVSREVRLAPGENGEVVLQLSD